VHVAEDLHLDVAGAPHELLQVDLVVAECRERFAARDLQVPGQLGLGFHHAHAAAAPAPARLEHHGIAHRCREAFRFPEVARQGPGGRHDGNADRDRELARGHLVAQRAHHLGPRADEDDSRAGAALGELGVLGKKPVAGVDGVDLRLARDAQDVVDVQIGGDRLPALAHRVALVGLEAVQREPVLRRVDADGADAHLGGGAHDADRYLAPVGDENAAYRFHAAGPVTAYAPRAAHGHHTRCSVRRPRSASEWCATPVAGNGPEFPCCSGFTSSRL